MRQLRFTAGLITAGLVAASTMSAPAFGSSSTPEQAEPSPSAPPQAESPAGVLASTAPEADIIALQPERYRRLTVPVTIMGQGPFNFMIDTGAQATVLSRSLADRLELFDRDTVTLVGMASRETVETTIVPDFMLGSRTFEIPTAPLVNGANIGSADGILGLDSLQDQRVLLDFDASTIAVANAEDLGGNAGYDIVVRAKAKLGQLVITRARLDGVRVSVIVDTGAQSSIGNPALEKRLRRAQGLGTTEMSDVNGEILTGSVKVGKSLEFGRAQLNHFPIVFADSPTFTALGLDGKPALILGMAELKLFKRVAIDFKSRRVLFELPSGTRVPDTSYFERFGE